jgi:hypothetical protein
MNAKIDESKDKKHPNSSKSKIYKGFLNVIKDNKLKDAFLCNETNEDNLFTYKKKTRNNILQETRIDWFLVEENEFIKYEANVIDLPGGIVTDHKLIELKVQINFDINWAEKQINYRELYDFEKDELEKIFNNDKFTKHIELMEMSNQLNENEDNNNKDLAISFMQLLEETIINTLEEAIKFKNISIITITPKFTTIWIPT